MRRRTESRRRSSKLSSSGSRSRRLSDYVKHISYDANLQFFKFTRSWKRNKWHSFLVIFTRPVLPPLLGQKHGSHHGPKNSRNFNSFQLPSRLSNGLSFYQRPSTNKSLANRQNRPEELNMWSCTVVPDGFVVGKNDAIFSDLNATEDGQRYTDMLFISRLDQSFVRLNVSR